MKNADYQILKKQITQHCWKINPQLNLPLSTKTSVRVGGPALFLINVSNLDELSHLVKITNRNNFPWFVLGKGSNLLVKDDGFPGVVIQLKGDFSNIELRNNYVICGAGVSNSRLSRFARKHSLSGTEFLSGIPGGIGGAVYMNAGAYGFEIKDIIRWVEFMDQNGQVHNLPSDRLYFSYRQTRFANLKGIILRVCLDLKPSDSDSVQATENKLQLKRRGSQPLNKHTWGSVFVNPPGEKVAKLIEACNLKGTGIGGAKFSTKHANFIENIGGATFEDLMATIELARRAVWEKYRLKLKMEGRIIPGP